jgi:hypothetical protein
MVPCHEVDMEDWSVINEWLDKVVYDKAEKLLSYVKQHSLTHSLFQIKF